MIVFIIIVGSFILDNLLTNMTNYQYNNLSLFTPVLTVISIFIIYPLFNKKKSNYYIVLFIMGIVYDLLFTNLVIVNGFLFLLIGYICRYIYNNFKLNIFNIVISLIIIISIYETSLLLLLVVLRLYDFSIIDLLYKISHSILLNILYGVSVYYILDRSVFKNKKVYLN